MDGAVEGAVRGGHRQRPLHRLCRLRDRLPPRRHRLRPRGRRLHAVPPRGRSSVQPTASTARRAAPAAPAPVPASAPGSPKPTITSSGGSASPRRIRASTRTSCSRERATTWSTAWARTAASCRRCSSGCASTTTSTAPSSRSSTARPGTGRPSPASPSPTTRSWRRRAAGTPTRPTPWRRRRRRNAVSSRLALVGMSCQSSVLPVMWHRKVGKAAKPYPVQHRAAVLEDLRRRHLRGAVRDEVRPAQAGHGQDEHQGRLPDLDARRRLPRDQPQGVPRLDPHRLHALPRLRRRARRRVDRRDRQGQRLDAHRRPHRPRP